MANGREDFVAALALAVVREIAPEEAVVFSAVRDSYFRDPEATLRGVGAGDRELGTGPGAIAEFGEAVIPYVLALASAVGASLLDRFGDAVVDLLLGRLRHGVEPVGSLSRKQEDAVREAARARARELGLPEEKVDEIIAAMLGSLGRDDR
ncbi:hypothetical protein [Actinosynnema mirum]|uniref:Ubiquinol-cytochrome c chaperone n=1 Tax=Actinosynnema mirum (strain ATCC 29888 / DSM 43827 / JCM 3225 / NBRC 14064 / NCIMB 13271 / NRRL B-12336 / IMRU 3971 / 101) TaxID=446462 RepID=C6WP84_ACTMD|nr:hypothetical protein [Actinosynnema mirum]ACU38586.1 ubiquinol-cytochrome c chaperone [Actinosynnema mirum DSM 43827]